MAQDQVGHGHDATGGGLLEAIVDPPRDPEPALAGDERAIGLADPHVHLGDAAAELGDQVAFRREALGQEEPLVVALDGGLIVELVERDVPQVLQGDDVLAFEAVLLRLRERAADVGLRAAQVPSDAGMLPEAKPGLNLATGVSALAEQRARAGKLLVRLLEPSELGQGDAQVEREVCLFVGEARAARLELTAAEFPYRALDLSRTQEAKAEEIAAPEHPLEVFKIPPADVIRGAEMLLRPRRPSDPPHRPAGGDVVLEDRLLLVRSRGVQLLELSLRQIGDLTPLAQTEQGAAPRQCDRVLEVGRQRSARLELDDEIDRRRETRVGDQLVQAPLKRRGVVLLWAVVGHGLKGARDCPRSRIGSPLRPSTDAEADQDPEIEVPVNVRPVNQPSRGRSRGSLAATRLRGRAGNILTGRISVAVRIAVRTARVDRSGDGLLGLDRGPGNKDHEQAQDEAQLYDGTFCHHRPSLPASGTCVSWQGRGYPGTT